MLWTDTLLQETVREKLAGLRLVVVANREPYIHVHTREEIVCERLASGMVSSLHDGMNLVAKEYLAAKNGEDGVLVLSRFTGAARKLNRALLINPYDTETFADTLVAAFEMGKEERRSRMHLLREGVRKNNIYRWAGKVLTTLASLRHDHILARSSLSLSTSLRHTIPSTSL